jgi:O-antigen/teichoic acid export membrane protein
LINQRIKSNTFSNIALKVSILLSVYATTPLIILYFGMINFNNWILINSLFIFFYCIDFGIGMGNTMNFSELIKDNNKKYQILFSSVIAIKIIIYFLMTVFLYTYNYFFLKIDFYLFNIIFLYQLFNFIGLVFIWSLWASGRNTIANYINSSGYILEILVFIFICVLSNGNMNAFIAYPLTSFLKLTLIVIIFQNFKDIKIKFTRISLISIKKYKEIIGFFFESIVSNIKNHGMRVIVAGYVSPLIFAQMITHITLINLTKYFTNILISVIHPELNFSKKNKILFDKIFFVYLRIGFFINIFCGVGIILIGEYIYKIWLSDLVGFNNKIFIYFLLPISLQGFNELISIAHMSVNRTYRYFSINFILLSIVLIIFILHKNIYILAVSLIMIELLLFFVNIYILKKQFSIPYKKFLTEVFSIKKFFYLDIIKVISTLFKK